MSSRVSENNKVKVFSVIVTYNALKWIKDCLDSVILDTTIVIVDNQSSDDTLSYIEKNYKGIIVLRQKENLGFGKANNIGISYALKNGADYLLLLNQDAKMEGNTIAKLVNFQKSNTKYGILTLVHCDWSGQFLEASFSRYINYKNNENFYSDFVLGKPTKEVYDVPFVAAACWFLQKKVFLDVGGFDPIFYHLGEDVNYTQRLRFYNYKIGVLPNGKVYHDTKDRLSKWADKYSEEYFYQLDYSRKIKLADVNLKSLSEKASAIKHQIQKEAIVALIQLKFSDFKNVLRELKEFNCLKRQAIKSVSINRKKGNHYL
jgi:GT2 family glycosyltransferase